MGAWRICGDRPTFREDLASRRCLVLVDGFYEWKSVPHCKRKIPYRITREDSLPFAFAGIWQEGVAPGALPRFAIISTSADAFMAPIHSRMPMILDRAEESAWISPRADASSLLGIPKSAYAAPLRMYEVSRDSPRATVDAPSLIEPVESSGGEEEPLFRMAKV